MQIRALSNPADLPALRRCLVELQDYERGLDPRLPPGEAIAEAYVAQLLERRERYDGAILVADVDGVVAGYASVWVRMSSGELEDGGLEYALVADLLVRAAYRRRGIARALLVAAEDHARRSGARCLRIDVLAANRQAIELYRAQGFGDYQVQLEKPLA